MQKFVEAIYEDGVFKPVRPVNITEHKRLVLIMEDKTEETSDIIALASELYDGLSKSDIEEIENIALDRDNFSRN